MSILKRSADLVYTFRFLKLLTTDFRDTEAFKLGVIDENGKKIKKGSLSSEEKSAYTTFHRLVFNIKKILALGPGRGKLASYVSALYLIKEFYGLSDKSMNRILENSDVDAAEILEESSLWFICEDRMLAPGHYKIKTSKLINSTCEELVKPSDRIRVEDNCYPVGSLFGMDVYEAIHIPTSQKVYVTAGELLK